MYPTRLDTYGCGCSHDCKYCYAKLILGFRGHWDPRNPRVADIWKIERALEKIPPGTILRMGGMTDCFQGVENKYGVTYETIKLLNKYRIGYLIVTKSPLVAHPRFLEIMDPDLAHVQISVTSLNHELSKLYETSPPPEHRVRAILALQKCGFDTAIRLSPLIEEHMNFVQLNRLNINKCIVEFLRLNRNLRIWMPSVNYDKYTLRYGNYWHLPLEEKLRIISYVEIPNISVCEKVPDHYDFWKKNFNPNPKDCCNLRIYSQQNVAETKKILTLAEVEERHKQAIDNLRRKR